jgi:UDP-3-O-[3-hydroxymyristoyl] glucosamine N-acyltransferase
VGPGERLAGIPAVDSMTWRRQQVRLRRLGEMEKRLKRLERKLDTDRSDPESHV